MITSRDKLIYGLYLENGCKVRPTVDELRSMGIFVYPETVRKVVAKFLRLGGY